MTGRVKVHQPWCVPFGVGFDFLCMGLAVVDDVVTWVGKDRRLQQVKGLWRRFGSEFVVKENFG